jgi:hypothetical protein
MMDDIATEITALDRMSTGDLAERYAELHGQPCRTRHRAYLIRKIAWRLQANAEGDLSERARRRAAELADDAEVRVMAPKTMICPPQHGEAATVTQAGADGARQIDRSSPALARLGHHSQVQRPHPSRCVPRGWQRLRVRG